MILTGTQRKLPLDVDVTGGQVEKQRRSNPLSLDAPKAHACESELARPLKNVS
jgi:hypothetical protein